MYIYIFINIFIIVFLYILERLCTVCIYIFSLIFLLLFSYTYSNVGVIYISYISYCILLLRVRYIYSFVMYAIIVRVILFIGLIVTFFWLSVYMLVQNNVSLLQPYIKVLNKSFPGQVCVYTCNISHFDRVHDDGFVTYGHMNGTSIPLIMLDVVRDQPYLIDYFFTKLYRKPCEWYVIPPFDAYTPNNFAYFYLYLSLYSIVLVALFAPIRRRESYQYV